MGEVLEYWGTLYVVEITACSATVEFKSGTWSSELDQKNSERSAGVDAELEGRVNIEEIAPGLLLLGVISTRPRCGCRSA